MQVLLYEVMFAVTMSGGGDSWIDSKYFFPQLVIRNEDVTGDSIKARTISLSPIISILFSQNWHYAEYWAGLYPGSGHRVKVKASQRRLNINLRIYNKIQPLVWKYKVASSDKSWSYMRCFTCIWSMYSMCVWVSEEKKTKYCSAVFIWSQSNTVLIYQSICEKEWIVHSLMNKILLPSHTYPAACCPHGPDTALYTYILCRPAWGHQCVLLNLLHYCNEPNCPWDTVSSEILDLRGWMILLFSSVFIVWPLDTARYCPHMDAEQSTPISHSIRQICANWIFANNQRHNTNNNSNKGLIVLIALFISSF